ncbi:MAG: transposase [Porphyromonadaceae bacterium]|nr:transposase [Porphyromonadaceae bacterium]
MLKKDITPELIQSLCTDNDKALRFIADIKWEKGFVCRKCGHTNFCSGKTFAARRCTRCKKEESATAHTIFHNCKFPVNKAFYIVYTVCIEKKRLSANDLASELELNPITCWKFRKKIQECVERYQNSSVDEINLIDIIITF